MATTSTRPFGNLDDGRPVQAVTLAAANGVEATVLTLGATLQAMLVPDARGARADVVLGHDTPQEYLSHQHYFGATVGRHANRIAQGRFALAGRHHQVERNHNGNHLHGGGAAAFHRQLWRLTEAADGAAVLTLRSADGEGGYPGCVEVTARYALDDAGVLSIDLAARTDAPTLVNLTHHSYFNLAGAGDAMAHRLTLDAAHYTPVKPDLIPTGEILPVSGTPFDFRQARVVGERIRDPHAQLRLARGYDHHLVVDGTPGTLRRAARLADPHSGRVLELHITAPGLQFYSGNFLDGSTAGKRGRACRQGDGLCLEPQGFPDAPNQPHFPSTRLLPGERYSNRMQMRFSVE